MKVNWYLWKAIKQRYWIAHKCKSLDCTFLRTTPLSILYIGYCLNPYPFPFSLFHCPGYFSNVHSIIEAIIGIKVISISFLHFLSTLKLVKWKVTARHAGWALVLVFIVFRIYIYRIQMQIQFSSWLTRSADSDWGYWTVTQCFALFYILMTVDIALDSNLYDAEVYFMLLYAIYITLSNRLSTDYDQNRCLVLFLMTFSTYLLHKLVAARDTCVYHFVFQNREVQYMYKCIMSLKWDLWNLKMSAF